MKKLLQSKLTAIQTEIKALPNENSISYGKLRAKELLIIEIMNEYETQMRTPIIKDIEDMYAMGLITTQERESKLNSIQVNDNY